MALRRFEGPARRRAVRVLDETVGLFGRAGYPEAERPAPLEARLRGLDRPPLVLRLVPVGRVFGGTYGLEIATEERVFGHTGGLAVRGRGLVRMQGLVFRPRRGDEAGRRLAERLGADGRLAEQLSAVHFERIRIEPDGRALVRHMGGSLVWFLLPPMIKGVPLVPEQVRATIGAMEALVRAGAVSRAG